MTYELNMDPIDLLHPSDRFILSLNDIISNIPATMLKLLIDPSPGLYLPQSIDPIIKLSDELYPRSKRGIPEYQFKSPIEIKDSKETVVTIDGTVVFTLTQIKRYSKFMSDKPFMNVIALKIAKIIADNYLSNMCPISKGRKGIRSISHLIKEEYRDGFNEDEFENIFSSMLAAISEFVGRDIWHIYFTKLSGTQLAIDKTVDYRVYWWHQDQHDKYCQDS